MKKFIFFTLLTVILGCTTTLTSQGRTVRLFQGEKHPSCEYVGLVDGSSSMGWGLDQDLIRARNEMLNEAARLGANWVKIDASSGNALTTIISGVAYKCDSNAEMSHDNKDYTIKLSPAYYNSINQGSNQIGAAISNSYQSQSTNSNQNNNWKAGQAPFCVMDNYGNLECYYYDLKSCRDALKYKTDSSACVKNN